VRAMTCLLHFYCKKNYSSVILHIACYETCQKASSSTCHYLCCFRNTFSVGSWMILTERTLKNCMCVCVCVSGLMVLNICQQAGELDLYSCVVLTAVFIRKLQHLFMKLNFHSLLHTHTHTNFYSS